MQQAAALFFKLFVGHAQFFLLRLQFLALPLRFLQQFGQARAQHRRAQGDADGVGAAFQQHAVQLRRTARLDTAQLHHANDLVIAEDRRQQTFVYRGAPQAGADLQHAALHLTQVAHLAIAQHLAQLAFFQPQRGRDGGRQRHATGHHQLLAFDAIDHRRLHVQVRSQSGHGRLGDPLRAQVTAQAHGHRIFGFLQPQGLGGHAPGVDGAVDNQRDGQETNAADGAVDEGEGGIVAVRRDVVAHHQADAGQHRKQQRQLGTALEDGHADDQEIRQPDRVAQWNDQLERGGHHQQCRRKAPYPWVTRA